MTTIGIIGVGFVGGAMKKSFEQKNINTLCYDKYHSYNDFEELSQCNIVFLCLPTPFVQSVGYDKDAIYETLDKLESISYGGIAVIKSTVEPGFTDNLSEKYSFQLFHNPEFLTARTAFEDFHNQTHVVIGRSKNSTHSGAMVLYNFYIKNYKKAKYSICTSTESESMKLFCNNFYAMKVMMFNHFYHVCEHSGADYEKVKELMFKNDWINPMHTTVPGPDGKFGYGGACFTKDTNALLEYSIRNGIGHKILEATIKERDLIRDDQDNVTKNTEEK